MCLSSGLQSGIQVQIQLNQEFQLIRCGWEWRERGTCLASSAVRGVCEGAAEVGSTQPPHTGEYGSAVRLCPASWGRSKAQILSLFLCASFSILVMVVTKSQSHGAALSPCWLRLLLLQIWYSWGFYCFWFCCSGTSAVVCWSLGEQGAADISSGLCFGSTMWLVSKHSCEHFQTTGCSKQLLNPLTTCFLWLQ